MVDPSRRFDKFGRILDERLPCIEDKGQRVIDYLNDCIVPQLRRSSSEAVRVAASRLTRLAEQPQRRRGA